MKSFGLSLLLLLCLIAGCGSSSGMAGKWVAAGPAPITMELKGDGTFEMVFDNKTNSKAAGTFEVSGSEITFTATKLNGFEVGEGDRQKISGQIAADGKSFTANNSTFTKQ